MKRGEFVVSFSNCWIGRLPDFEVGSLIDGS